MFESRVSIRPRLRALAVGIASCAVFALNGGSSFAGVDPFTSHAQSATSLVMPFDVRSPTSSTSLIVSYSHGLGISTGLMSTHWSFWDQNGSHLADIFVCLRKGDTTVVDPRNLQSVGPNNETSGPIIDLRAHRGFVTVTAYLTNASCAPGSQTGFVLGHSLIGAFSITDPAQGTTLTHGALGLQAGAGGAMVDLPAGLLTGGLATGGIEVQTLNPSTLSNSVVVLLGLKERAGTGPWNKEIGPFTRKVAASVLYFDDQAIATSLPDVSFRTARFTSVGPATGALIPSPVSIDSPGFLRLEDFRFGRARNHLGDDEWVYAFVGESAGGESLQDIGKYVYLGADVRLIRYRNDLDCLPGFGFISTIRAGNLVWRAGTGSTSDYVVVNQATLGPFVETGCGNLVFNYANVFNPSVGRRYLLRQTPASTLTLTDEGPVD